MDNFTPIDRACWPREEIYRLYTDEWTPTLFSMHSKMDVTEPVAAVKARGEKVAPALLYVFSREVNRQENFRIALREGVLGVWDVIHPIYPVLNPTGNFTFHTIRAEGNYRDFCEAYRAEAERTRNAAGAFAEGCPENFFTISVVPFLTFEGVSFSLRNPRYYYAPILTLGKYRREGDRLIMPFSITCNHATADASHVAALIEGVEKAFRDPEEWLE